MEQIIPCNGASITSGNGDVLAQPSPCIQPLAFQGGGGREEGGSERWMDGGGNDGGREGEDIE